MFFCKVNYKSGYTNYYQVKVYNDHDWVGCIAEGKECYSEVMDIFWKVYPYVQIKLKRNLIFFILNATKEEKEARHFPKSIYDDGIKIKYVPNPYDESGESKLYDLSWKDLKATLSDNHMECLIYSIIEGKMLLKVNVESMEQIENSFDYYVLYDIITDLHKEGVNKFSELSYMKG